MQDISNLIIEQRQGQHYKAWIPRYCDFPDAERISSLRGTFRLGGEFRLGSIRTSSGFENRGYASALLAHLKENPEIMLITASVDVGAEEFYKKNGFRYSGKGNEYIWP